MVNNSYLQLIAKGAQDKELTSNPQMSYFKSVFKRYTNFAQTSVEVPLMGDTSFGGLCRAVIPRVGDLLTDAYISIELPAVTVSGPGTDGLTPTVRWASKLGHALLEYVEVSIGNEVIVRHTGEYLELLTQLTMRDEQKKLYNNMIGQKGTLINDMPELEPQFLYVPLQFWWCRRSGLGLPICALSIHDIEIRIKLKKEDSLLLTFDAQNKISVGRLENISIFCEYVHLDDFERKKFCSKEHEYLIEQVQYSGVSDIGGARGNSVDVEFNHPVKELIWTGQRLTCLQSQFVLNSDGFPDYNQPFIYGSSSTPGESLNMFATFLLQANGNELIKRESNYFNLYLPWKHHSNSPDVGVYMYSFALEPEKYQPSGTMNFSELDSFCIKVEFNDEATLPCVLKVYGRNYNVLEIRGGQGALRYVQ